MAESMFGKAAKLPKRVPKWAWYVSGGVLVAGGIYYIRSGQSVDEPAGDPVTDQGMVGYTDPLNTPGGIIVPATGGAEAVPAEINTDIPTATLDIFGGLFADLVGLVQSGQDTQDSALQIIAGAGSPQAGSDAGGVVTATPPSAPAPTAPAPTPAAPKPNPCTKLEGGYNCGSTVVMGDVRKSFSGAIGWARIDSGGTGADHWIDVHVRFCSKLERWRVHPNRAGDPWAKIWSGARPNIC